MSRPSGKTVDCDRAGARTRLRQAEAFVSVAELALDDQDEFFAGAAAAVAVLAGIAASDAACCARLGLRFRGPDHAGAVDLVKTVRPEGDNLARDLARLLSIKDSAHYGILAISGPDARSAVTRARRMTDSVARILA
jgi:hypothetical protein